MISGKAARTSVAFLAAVFALIMVVSSWAYWTQEKTVLNEYQLGKYSTALQEIFDPPSDWLPGQLINKDVSVVNKGSVPVFVKVVIDQEWIRRENVFDTDGKVVAPAKGEPFPLNFLVSENEREYAALLSFSKDVVLLKSGVTDDSSLSLGLPTVNEVQDALGKWLLVNETPDENGSYTFYYIGVLDGARETPRLLDGVELNPAILPLYLSEKYTFKTEDGKTVSEPILKDLQRNGTHSFENAHYTLGVTMYTVQATEAAIHELFHSDQIREQSIISYMETLAVKGTGVDFSRDDKVKEKKLYFTESNGTMTYIPVIGSGISNGEDGWFMSHLNMLPGESYEDTMLIENLSSKKFHLYMQVVPLKQEKLPDELLEYIHMKVYHGDTLLYDGTAAGKEYKGSIRNLRDVISLGVYDGSAKKNIRVVLTLDKDTPIEYAGIYSQIDWKFMVEENNIPTPDPGKPDGPTPNPGKPSGPKTGDTSHETLYVCIMTICGSLMIACIAWLVTDMKRKKQN